MRRTVHRSPVLRSSCRHAPRAPAVTAGPAGSTKACDVLLATELTRLALASSNLAVGYAVTARHARDERLAGEIAALASAHRALASDLVALLTASGKPGPRITSTCGERLRWEWLASAGRLMDGSAESRLVAECARIQKEADAAIALLTPRASAAPASLRRILAGEQAASGTASRVARALGQKAAVTAGMVALPEA